MRVRVTIDTENDAFQGGNWGREVARLLRLAAQRVADEQKAAPRVFGYRVGLMDTNGNSVGELTAGED